jgi:Glycerophosphoryl diester phosphodiesterase family
MRRRPGPLLRPVAGIRTGWRWLHSPGMTSEYSRGPLPSGAKPFLVAHRAGNRLVDLRAAELLGAALVEADIRLHLGRLEVRHLRTVGPLPILWDRWQLAAPWRRRLVLSELLEATAAETELMLDLKGSRLRVAEKTVEAIRPYLGNRRFTVCSREWRLLEPFAGLRVRRLHSIGDERELERFLDRFSSERLEGVSIHERLLGPESVASLRSIADILLTWTVNRPARAQELVRLGVDGLITDDVAALQRPGILGAPA